MGLRGGDGADGREALTMRGSAPTTRSSPTFAYRTCPVTKRTASWRGPAESAGDPYDLLRLRPKSYAREGRQDGLRHVLFKPFRVDQLLNALTFNSSTPPPEKQSTVLEMK